MKPNKRTLVVFFSAYSHEQLINQGLEIFVTSKDLNGVFEKVVTINSVASLQSSEVTKFCSFQLDERNLLLEGSHTQGHPRLQILPPLDFAISQLKFLSSVKRSLKDCNVVAVRGEDPRLNGFYAWMWAKKFNVPLAIGVWGNPARIRALTGKPLLKKLFRYRVIEEVFERIILSRANIVMAQNLENMQYALDRGVAQDKTRITPLGLGIDILHFQEPGTVSTLPPLIGFELPDKFLICVSRLEELKMVDHAIKAFAYASQNDPSIHLLILGEGSQKENLQRLTEELNIKSKVHFLGSVSQVEIREIAMRAVLNLAPLCGRSLLEVSLSGCPSVAYDIDWHSELITDGLDGFLVKKLSVKDFGLRIEQALSENVRLEEMRKFIRITALKQADHSRLLKEQLSLYSDLLGANWL